MKYKCLILDHDDTVVDSTKELNFPAFRDCLINATGKCEYTLEDYLKYSFNPGFFIFLKDICKLTDEQISEQHDIWINYVLSKTPKTFKGMKEALDEYVKLGGIITVVSHSESVNIKRDYKVNELPTPSIIFGSDVEKEYVKPSPLPVLKIIEELNLDKKDVLVVDDLKPGLVMARNAGVDFAASAWCFDVKEIKEYMQENADYFLKSIDEFRELILK